MRVPSRLLDLMPLQRVLLIMHQPSATVSAAWCRWPGLPQVPACNIHDCALHFASVTQKDGGLAERCEVVRRGADLAAHHAYACDGMPSKFGCQGECAGDPATAFRQLFPVRSAC